MKKNLQAVVVLAAWFVAACGGNAIDARAVGLYRLDQTSMRLGKADFGGQAAEAGKNASPQEASFGMGLDLDVTFDLRADGTAVMRAKTTHNGQPVEESTTGAWRLAGGKLTIERSGPEGVVDAKTFDYADGVFTMAKQEGGKTLRMTFRKQ
jgi:hypothetical protein